MRAAIGRESAPVIYEVDNLGCRQFARAVGYTDPIYYDEEAARAKGYRGIVAPIGFLGHPIYDPARPPRGPEASGMNIPYKRVLNGGTDIEYFGVVCAGDRLTATSKVTDLQEREGRVGPMLIVNTETTFRDDSGAIVAVMRGTVIRY
jgi:acyl dehydratase